MCRQPHSPEESPTAQHGPCEPAPGPTGCSCCQQRQWDTRAGFLLRQELARQQSCCSCMLGHFLGAASKRVRLSRRCGWDEEEIIPVHLETSPIQQWCWE